MEVVSQKANLCINETGESLIIHIVIYVVVTMNLSELEVVYGE